MANEMPNPDDYKGLSRKVLQYGDTFRRIVEKAKQPRFSEADWAPLEDLVDVDEFERVGVFLSGRAEVISWPQLQKVFVSVCRLDLVGGNVASNHRGSRTRNPRARGAEYKRRRDPCCQHGHDLRIQRGR